MLYFAASDRSSYHTGGLRVGVPGGSGWLWAVLLCSQFTLAQDSSTGALGGTVYDPAGARASGAAVNLAQADTGLERDAVTDSGGRFEIQLLLPGNYTLTVTYLRFAPYQRTGVQVDIGSNQRIEVKLEARKETVTVSGEAPLVETQPSGISSVIEENAIEDLPLNGRRFSDLALLTPGVTQDPRGLTSSANGDLAFGGLRGYHTQFLVDGSDNNNAFFAQARGRYRAPYQFSNEVVQEFVVSSNSYGAELAGSAGAVVNVVTRSGENYVHGSGFYYIRDSAFNARPPFVGFKPQDRQQQFGFTLGGPIKKDKAFFFAGFDQHVFHVPTVVKFDNGQTALTPVATNGRIAGDYEPSDRAIVFAAAAKLDVLAGEQRAALLGNAGFAKADAALTPHEHLSARLSTSRYYGSNNVFFDPASPITNFANSNNGEEDVATESASAILTSAISARWTSHARVQFSHDLQESTANSSDPLQKITGVLDGMGRSNILPRQTSEHRLHLAETLSRSGGRHDWKFGGDVGLVWIRNFFPSQFGGEYIFDPVKVNPFTFVPQEGGLELTPLRAYAHGVPKYYEQNFGTAVSHPDTHEFAWFAQDAIRVSDHFALDLGVRYELQTFRSDGLIANPRWPGSGRVPTDRNNFAPRAGFAYSIGDERPLVVRGGFGLFYALIPQIYTSAVETNNGINSTHLFIQNPNFEQRVEGSIFPQYPDPLVDCPAAATTCAAPQNTTGQLTSDISAFAANFETPYSEQASASVEREIGWRMAVEANYLFVHGVHLTRARDANLPKPVVLSYPVFDDSGTNFLGTFYNVDSFSTWQFTPSFTCPFPPCINPLSRPIAKLGAVNVFESAASSVYHGMTLSLKRRMTRGLYLHAAYTWAHAIDDNQDALVAGAPATVQNSHAPAAERGASVTDQRHRFVFSSIWEPRPFHLEHPTLKAIFDDWRLANIVTVGSGRPVGARVIGDANQDGNTENDRLPGVSRNSFTGPGYATADLRLSRTLHAGDRLKLELLAESFNLLNRDNRRVDITDNGFQTSAAQFVNLSAKVNGKHYPASLRSLSSFLKPTSAYAPRQVQLAIKVVF